MEYGQPNAEAAKGAQRAQKKDRKFLDSFCALCEISAPSAFGCPYSKFPPTNT